MVKWVPPLITILVVLWLIFMGVLLVLEGNGTLDYHPSVLVALLGSATVSILALLMRIVSYTLPQMEWMSE